MATTKAGRPSRLMREMLTLAGEMHADGTMDEAAYCKFTMRDVGKIEASRSRL